MNHTGQGAGCQRHPEDSGQAATQGQGSKGDQGESEGRPQEGFGGGLVIGGSITGGAIATGSDSTARDTSRTAGGVPPAELPVPTASPGPLAPGQVHVGGHVLGGALATGSGSTAEYQAIRVDAGHQRLLEAIGELRQALRVLAPSAEVTGAEAELAAVDEEIARTGRAEPGRLRRLRDRLTGADTVLAALASAATVVHAIQGLVG